MTDYVQAIKHLSDGSIQTVNLPISDLEQEFTYTAGNLTAIKVIYQNITYVQIFNYVSGNLVSISQWGSV